MSSHELVRRCAREISGVCVLHIAAEVWSLFFHFIILFDEEAGRWIDNDGNRSKRCETLLLERQMIASAGEPRFFRLAAKLRLWGRGTPKALRAQPRPETAAGEQGPAG